jgi:hypothetical protein
VVVRGGIQIVVQAQAASFSLPHCWLERTVPAGQSIAGAAGHSLSLQER